MKTTSPDLQPAKTTEQIEIDRVNATAKVKDSEQPKFPLFFAISMFVGPFAWLAPAGNARGILIPQLFSEISPSGKIAAIATLASVVMIVAAISNIVFGALSDMTRTRFGKRKPWIVIGTIIEAGLLVVIAYLHSIAAIIVLFGVLAAAENAVAAAMIAQTSDRVAPRWRGSVSTFYGISFTAITVVAILTAQFLGNVRLGFLVLAGICIVAGAIHVLLANEKSNLDEPKAEINPSTFKRYFFIPTKGARDYYLALIGKFFMNTGGTVVALYQLYIFTDYMHLDDAAAGKAISIMSTIILITGIIFCAISGPIADRAKRLKAPVALTTMLMGVAMLFPFFSPTPMAMYVYAAVSGIGSGIYNSIDGALNLAVLPDAETAGKDLGIINLANTLSQISGTVIASAIVSSFGYHYIFPSAFIACLIGGLAIFAIKKVK